MVNLNRYAHYFNDAYPGYSDSRYKSVADLVRRYGAANVADVLQLPQFAESVALIQPLIAVKNFKSEIPFPLDVSEVVSCIVDIRTTHVRASAPLANHEQRFCRLLSYQGFQLPTVSAVFHFTHPRHFPIVDVNVQAACGVLSEEFPADFRGLAVPILPGAGTSSANKVRKYIAFIAFIKRVLSLQRAHTAKVNYRYIDKALMVLGVPSYRRAAETKERLRLKG